MHALTSRGLNQAQPAGPLAGSSAGAAGALPVGHATRHTPHATLALAVPNRIIIGRHYLSHFTHDDD